MTFTEVIEAISFISFMVTVAIMYFCAKERDSFNMTRFGLLSIIFLILADMMKGA